MGESGPSFMAPGECQRGVGPQDCDVQGCAELGAPSSHHPLSVLTARELLQRAERKEDQTRREGARLALNQGPTGRAKCCAR